MSFKTRFLDIFYLKYKFEITHATSWTAVYFFYQYQTCFYTRQKEKARYNSNFEFRVLFAIGLLGILHTHTIWSLNYKICFYFFLHSCLKFFLSKLISLLGVSGLLYPIPRIWYSSANKISHLVCPSLLIKVGLWLNLIFNLYSCISRIYR